MKKTFYLLGVLLLSGLILFAQTPAKRYTVAFYNVENLFDTIKDPVVFDEEFTPAGPKKWNTQKYTQKMQNLEKVFYELSAATKGYPTIIGISEVENRNVLEDLVSMPRLQRANYQIAHYDSPDPRGIDVALLYRGDQFKYEGSFPITTIVPSLPGFKTRDILSVWGTIEGEPFCFFVCHWPSRRGGQQASEFKRVGAAQTVRHAADSIMKLRPETKIVVMGDLNDDPVDASIYEALGAKGDRSKIGPFGFYNPFYEMFKKGYGTLAYNDAWNLFDNIIVNSALANAPKGTLKLTSSERSEYLGNIFNRPFLLQQTGQFKGYPLRTFVGNNFQGGYSDHFPVYIFLAK